MFRFLIRVGVMFYAWLTSPQGKFVTRAVENAVPLIRDISRRRKEGDRPTATENVKNAKIFMDKLLEADPAYAERFMRQQMAFNEVYNMLLEDDRVDNKDITFSSVMKIVELAHGASKTSK